VAVGRAVFRGEEDGGRWTPLGEPSGSDELIGVAAGRGEYAWTQRTVYAHRGRSTDWEDIGATLPSGVDVRAVAVDGGGRRDVLLAATSGGIWWRDDGGDWNPAHGASSIVPFESILVPETGLIMAGSAEHGVFVGVNLVTK
jgi:hypothetical protein